MVVIGWRVKPGMFLSTRKEVISPAARPEPVLAYTKNASPVCVGAIRRG